MEDFSFLNISDHDIPTVNLSSLLWYFHKAVGESDLILSHLSVYMEEL